MAEPIQIGGGSRRQAIGTSVPASQAIARGLGDLGAASQAIGQRIERDQINSDKLRAVELSGQYKREALKATEGLDPTADDYLQSSEEALREAREGVLTDPGISNRQVLESLSVDLERQLQGNLTAAVAGRQTAVQDKALRLNDELSQDTIASILNDPDGIDAYLEEHAGKAGALLDSVDPTLHDQMADKFGDNAIQAQIEGLANQGRHDEAKAALDEAAGELKPGIRRQMAGIIRGIENQQRQDELSATSSRVADFNIKVRETQSVSEINQLRTQLEEAREGGFFEGREGQFASMVRELEGKRQRIVDTQKDITVALANRANGLGADNQKQADQMWNAETAGLDPADNQSAVDRLVEFAPEVGFIPSTVKKRIEAAERTESPELLAFAAQTDSRVREAAPGVRTGAGDRTAMVQGFRDMGMSWDDAATLTLERIPDDATKKVRKEQQKEVFKEFDVDEYLDNVDLAPQSFLPFADDTIITDQLRQDATNAVQMLWQLSGDMEAAKAGAAELLKSRAGYGQTDVGNQGAPIATRYPVESHMGSNANELDPVERTEVVDEAVLGGLSAAGIQPEDGRYLLISDKQTQRNVESGIPPSYEVRIPGRFGTMVPVPVSTEGRRQLLRFTAPTNQSLESSPAFVKARAKEVGRGARGARQSEEFRQEAEKAFEDPVFQRFGTLR